MQSPSSPASGGSRTRIGRTLHRRAERLGWIIAGLLMAFVLLCLLTFKPGRASLYPPARDAATTPVRVSVSYKWMHAQLALPRSAIEEAGGPAAEALEMTGDGSWVMIGWGDEAYYRERGLTGARLLDFLRSMFEPDSPSVIEFDPEPAPPAPATTGQTVFALELSQPGTEALLQRLNGAFDLESGAIIAAGRGRDPGSQFFKGHESSDLARNCNHWVADLLHAAGVPSIDLLNTLSAGLAVNLQGLAGAERLPGNPEDHEPGPETPPSHSGRYAYLAGSPALAGSDIIFDGYSIWLKETWLRTSPAGLLVAGDSGLADILGVPDEGLVGIRRIDTLAGKASLDLCEGAAPSHLAIGFRSNDGGPYGIALAAYGKDPASAATKPCAVAHYRQP